MQTDRRTIPLWAKIILALFLGVTSGLVISPNGMGLFPQHHANHIACWLAFPGHIFLALIKMIILPLIVSSIILGVNSSGDADFLKRLGVRIAPYFLFTTAVAVSIGIVVTWTLKPGEYIDSKQFNIDKVKTQSLDVRNAESYLPEKIANLIPDNPIESAVSLSMFEIVVFSVLIAIALLSISKAKAQPLIDLCTSLQDVSMKVVSWSMKLAPYAVYGLIAQITVKIGYRALVGLSMYVITVLIGLAILFLFYLLIISFFSKSHPWTFLKSIREVQLLAFTTSSSAAVMPLSMDTAEKKLKIEPKISKFVIPVGATVNMDGTALYQLSAALFLTQVYGIHLSLPELGLLAATTIGASIGSPSTPGVGIVILATILYSIGIPDSGVALLLGVDRILDMSRTAINVTGDLTACAVMDHYLEKSS